MNTSPDTDAWGRYWASGQLHSCPNAFAGNYGDELREFWLDFFGGLPDGARVLDLGTGNGAVAFLARDAADGKGRQFHIDAIDAAAIDPSTAAERLGIPLGNIVFRGHVHCEHTDYPDRHFDAVSSQYAIEYMHLDDALRELARILKSGGRAGFVLHHGDSEALESARLELKAFDYLSHDAPLVLAARQLLRRLAAARDPRQLAALAADRDSRRLRKDVEKQLRRVVAYARAPGRGAAFLEGIAAQVAGTLRTLGETSAAGAMRRLAGLEQEMDAHRRRLTSIARAARDREGMEAFCRSLAAAGFAPGEAQELRRGGRELLGWAVTATH